MKVALTRFTPLRLSPTTTLAHRVVVPAMASGTAAADGRATPATLEHYRRLALAEPSLLFAEYTFVHASGRSEPQQLGASSDTHLDGLAAVVRSISSRGAVAGLQLTHAGGKSDRSLTGGTLPSPSGIVVPARDRILETPDVMTLEDIETWRAAFLAAACRGVAAGFQVIEIHAAHGYGFNQWLSPLTNRRTDRYGGSAIGRSRLLLEVLAEIRRAAPDVVLSVRIPGQDHLPGGLSSADAQALARRLVAAGVGIINVSSGLGGWRRPRDRVGEGYLVAEAASVQAVVEVPVIGVGGIASGTFIDQSLNAGSFSLAAVGRAILKDPAQWQEEQMQPRASAERKCLAVGQGRSPGTSST